MEYRNIVLASYDEISNARAQGTSYEEIAKTATASAREFDDMMKQSERSMLEVSANAQMARERLAALRATPPRCDADERSMGMAEAAFRAYAVYYMASIGNRAVAAIAACRARAGL
jgi:hypothetical protein